MMATVPHVTSGLGLRKFQADGFLLTRVYIISEKLSPIGQLNRIMYFISITKLEGHLRA